MQSFRKVGERDPISKECLQPMADFILEKCMVKPVIGIICGTGLGELGDLVKSPTVLHYSEIQGFPVSTVPGHEGKLIIGSLENVDVVIMKGRFHCYEGYALWEVCLPVRVMKLLGIKNIIVTNAVGALNQSYKEGDIMLVKDHLTLMGLGGENPLRGPNDPFFGERFFEVNSIYSHKWRDLAKEAIKEVGVPEKLREGVLTISGGPNYETTSELRMLSLMGADCVGMSSIPECLVAHHCGIAVLAFCLITNICSTDFTNQIIPNHEEVLQVGEESKAYLKQFVSTLVPKIKACQT